MSVLINIAYIHHDIKFLYFLLRFGLELESWGVDFDDLSKITVF